MAGVKVALPARHLASEQRSDVKVQWQGNNCAHTRVPNAESALHGVEAKICMPGNTAPAD